jgi:chemosensory pili system protein ChpC
MSVQTLRSFVIAFRGGQAVLPGSSMIEVLPFATPLTLDGAPVWVVGSMLWRALNVPLVDLGCLIYDAEPDIEVHSRIVMVNALTQDRAIPYLGLLGTDAPRLLSLDRSQIVPSDMPLERLEHDEPGFGVLAWVQVNDKAAVVPDLVALGARLAPFVRRSN